MLVYLFTAKEEPENDSDVLLTNAKNILERTCEQRESFNETRNYKHIWTITKKKLKCLGSILPTYLSIEFCVHRTY